MIRDLNLVIGAHKKMGQLPSWIASLEFLNAIEGSSLLQIETKGSFFSHGHVDMFVVFFKSKLDRSICYKFFIDFLDKPWL